MNFKIDLLLLVVACVGYAVTQEMASSELSKPTSPPTTTPSITTEKNTSSSTARSTTVTTTVTTTTSTEPSTSSSSVQPNTTFAPNTTTTHPPTSHATTTRGPAPAPPKDKWFVEFNNTFCILVKAEISIEFKYTSTSTNKSVTTSVPVPTYANTTANGTCGLEKQSIKIGFFSHWVLTLVFERSNDSKSYHQSEVSLVWDLKDAPIPDAPHLSGENRNLKPMFDTSKAGYLCMARMTLYDNSTANEGLLAIYTKGLQLEAFQKKSTGDFSDYERCKEDTISNLVPIIVGACLGGLIIIVLIAYLIGRKRSRRGYESV